MADNLNPEGFDLDAWIDGVERPTITVDLYPHEAQFAARVARIEEQIEAAEKVAAENRGMDDDTPETLAAQLDELRREREASTVHVKVWQLTRKESVEVLRAHKEREDGPDDSDLWMVAASCVEPKFTAAQLDRLRNRDRSGEEMYAQLHAATMQVLQGLPVPS